MRKSYTANFKTKQVLTLLREEKTLTELASESGVHPNQLRNWRDLVLQEMDTLFEKKEATTQMRAAHEAERARVVGGNRTVEHAIDVAEKKSWPRR